MRKMLGLLLGEKDVMPTKCNHFKMLCLLGPYTL